MRTLALIFSLFFSITATAGPAAESSQSKQALEHMVLMYFLPDNSQSLTQVKAAMKKKQCLLNQNKVEVLLIENQDSTYPNWVSNQFNIEAMRKVLNVQSDVPTSILYGRDGKEKKRWHGDNIDSFSTIFLNYLPSEVVQSQKKQCDFLSAHQTR